MIKMTDELKDIKGMGPATLEKLESAGVSTLMALAVSSAPDIASVAGISESVARKLIKQARESLKLGFEVAKEFAKKRDKIMKVSVGCNAFDTMLEGGIESGSITEVYGKDGAGKTQLAHILVVRALLEHKDNKAIFIDSENTFRADRIKDFALANGVEYDDAMSRIFVARAYNSDHQQLLLEEAEKMLQSDADYRVLVVDSLTSHFRSEFIGRGTLANRQQKLNKHMHLILKIADLYNLAVLVTNQVMAKPDSFYGDPTTAIGGHIVGHNCLEENTLIYHPEGLSLFVDFAHKLLPRPILSEKNGKIVIDEATYFSKQYKKTKKIYSYNIIEATDEHRFPILSSDNKYILRKTEDLEIGDMLLVPKKIKMKGKLQKLIWNYTSKYNGKTLQTRQYIDENVAYLLGVILGDGNIDKRSIGIRDKRKENLEKVNSMFSETFDISGRIKKIPFKNAFGLRIHSIELAKNLDIKHNTVKFLELISKSPEKVRMAFISGLIDTDGSLCREIIISQENKTVLDFVQGMLLMSGVHSIIREQINDRGFSKTNGMIRHLRIRSAHCRTLAKKLSLKYKKSDTLDKYLERKSKSFYKLREYGDFIAYPILNIEDGEQKTVIDMEVKENHVFIANGMLTHNSTFRIYMRPGKAGSIYAKVVDSPNLPQNDCNFNITRNGFQDV